MTVIESISFRARRRGINYIKDLKLLYLLSVPVSEKTTYAALKRRGWETEGEWAKPVVDKHTSVVRNSKIVLLLLVNPCILRTPPGKAQPQDTGDPPP
jgi:hypothetical protein